MGRERRRSGLDIPRHDPAADAPGDLIARIVVCEDDPTIQKLIRAALRSSDHELRVAADGAEGLALIKADPPDLIMTDVSMPKMDGFQLGDAILADEALRGIPLVFLTASVERTAIEECYRHGATAYIGKPFGTGELRDRVNEIIRTRASGVTPEGL